MSVPPRDTPERRRYNLLHFHVPRKRGKASKYRCVDCHEPAAQWSTIHGRSGENYEADYEPRCVRCHVRYDETEFKSGSDNPSAKLTEEIVIAVRECLEAGVTGKLIASEIDVSRATISLIKNRKIWQHI